MSHRASPPRTQTTLIDAPEPDPFLYGRSRVNLLPLPERRPGWPVRDILTATFTAVLHVAAVALMAVAAVALALHLT